MNIDKNKWNSVALLICGIFLFVFVAPVLMIGEDAIKPVKDASGAIVHKANGSILFQGDTWGNIKINWKAYLAMLAGAFLVVFALHE